MTVLHQGVRWCPACLVRAQGRGTVRTIPNPSALDHDDEPHTLLVLWYDGRSAGELWSVIPEPGAICACCREPLTMAFEVRAARRRGLGRSPREAPQGPGLFDRVGGSKR